MLRINDKEFVFTTSALMEPGESATLTVPELPDLSFRLLVDRRRGGLSTGPQDFRFQHARDEGVVMISFPFLENGHSLSGNYNLHTAAGDLGLILAANAIGALTQVHLHAFRTRMSA